MIGVPTFVVIVLIVVVVLIVTSSSRKDMARSDSRLCRACGTTHPSFAQFCRRCGRKL